MKRQKGAKLRKTSITVPQLLMDFAEERCQIEGYNSLSAYLAELIRREKREIDLVCNKLMREPDSSGHYGEHLPQSVIIEDRLPKKKKPSSSVDTSGKTHKAIADAGIEAVPDAPPKKPKAP